MAKKRKGLIGKFFKVVISIVLGFIISSTVIVASGMALGVIANPFSYTEEGGVVINDKPITIVNKVLGKEENKILNVAVFGVDKGGTRTDVIFIVHYETLEGKVCVMSIPRDTRVDICEKATQIMDENGKWYPTTCKINEVHAYAGKDNASKCSVYQLEDLLDINIDYYVKINTDGFRSVVDMIGGVEVDVPQNMYYQDPVQGLNINLKAGLQTLDGDMAEQLVRFRSYPQGDIQRVKTQQLFMKAFLKKVLDPKVIVSNLPEYIKSAFNYVETDVPFTEALQYIGDIKKVNLSGIKMETIPGVPQYINGGSYYVVDEFEARTALNKLFNAKPLDEALMSFDKKIEISNGSHTNGLATKNEKLLKNNGYNVINVLTFEGEKTEETRIYVKSEGVGVDLKEYYYPNSQIIVDETKISEGADILIILGTSEK